MTIELSVAPEAEALRTARGQAREAAARLGAGERECDTIALVVDELVNNAFEHGAVYRRASLPLIVRIAQDDSRYRIEFIDREMPAESVRELHDALAESAQGAPSLENERGRGLFLLSVYLESLAVVVDSGGGMCLSGVLAEATD